ncbi:MAG: hypothetical protein Q8Q31_03725 [Nanoarchaeota archaeon]|nr:hypothetical protein [Nanoarchaeota archaeon]
MKNKRNLASITLAGSLLFSGGCATISPENNNHNKNNMPKIGNTLATPLQKLDEWGRKYEAWAERKDAETPERLLSRNGYYTSSHYDFFPGVQISNRTNFIPSRILKSNQEVFFSYTAEPGEINPTNHNMRLYIMKREKDASGERLTERVVIYPGGFIVLPNTNGTVEFHYNFKEANEIGPTGSYVGIWRDSPIPSNTKQILRGMYVTWINPFANIFKENEEKKVLEFKLVP